MGLRSHEFINIGFIAALNAAITVPAVLGGSAGGGDVAIPAKAHSKKLRDLLVQVLPGQVWANSSKEKRSYPDAVYKIGGSTVIENLSVPTGGETIFAVFLHAETHDDATIKFDAIDALLSAEEGIQITDIASNYNEKTGTHEIAFEVVINTPLAFDGTGSVVAIRGSCSADENQAFPCLQQSRVCQYHFIVQAKDQSSMDFILNELELFALGKSESREHDLLQEVSNQPLQSSGGLLSRVVTYSNSKPITATAHS